MKLEANYLFYEEASNLVGLLATILRPIAHVLNRQKCRIQMNK